LIYKFNDDNNNNCYHHHHQLFYILHKSFGLLVSDLMSKKKIVDRISLKLDIKYPVIKNWEDLAFELGAPENIQAKCKRTTDHSPTELLFESLSSWSQTENLQVNELIAKLTEMDTGSQIVVEVIKNHIPGTVNNIKLTCNHV
jgi:hypothetical protein